MNEEGQLKVLYENRFSSNKELAMKNAIWKTLCKHFFQKRIREIDVVADVASGYCEFINNIKASKKYAIDLNPDVVKFSNPDVTVINSKIEAIDLVLEKCSVDVFFVSNFLEHLESKQQIIDLFSKLEVVLKNNGKIMILQPNIKYVKKGKYWDYFDHKIPLTEQALIELAGMFNFDVIECIPKFLPYTTKNAMPKHPAIIWAYLKLMPISNYFFGEQSFVVFQKKA